MQDYGTAVQTYMAFLELAEGMSEQDSYDFTGYFDQMLINQVSYIDILEKLHQWKDNRCE